MLRLVTSGCLELFPIAGCTRLPSTTSTSGNLRLFPLLPAHPVIPKLPRLQLASTSPYFTRQICILLVKYLFHQTNTYLMNEIRISPCQISIVGRNNDILLNPEKVDNIDMPL